MEEAGKVKFTADLAAQQWAEVEFAVPNGLWGAAGFGIETVDLWMKDVISGTDLRVKILRRGSSIEISVDRGEQSGNWWPLEACPKLLVALDESEVKAVVAASIGSPERPRTIKLGEMSL